MAKPRHLALGILAGVVDGDPARLVSDSSPRKWRNSSGAPCALRPGQRGSGARSKTARTSASTPAFSMASKRVSMRGAQPAPLGRQQHRDEAPAHGLRLPLLPGAERPAGRPPNFPGADMALAVAGLQPRHDRRIVFGKPRAEAFGAHRLPVRIGLVAQAGRRIGNGGDALHQCPQIKTRAAAQDGRAALGQAALDLGRGERPPARGRQGLRQRQHAIEPMRHTRPLVARWAVRSGSGRHRRSAWRRH